MYYLLTVNTWHLQATHSAKFFFMTLLNCCLLSASTPSGLCTIDWLLMHRRPQTTRGALWNYSSLRVLTFLWLLWWPILFLIIPVFSSRWISQCTQMIRVNHQITENTSELCVSGPWIVPKWATKSCNQKLILSTKTNIAAYEMLT